MRNRVHGYVRRALLLRQIHSNKGSSAQRRGRNYVIVTVVVAAVVSVIGFMGPDRLAGSMSRIWPVEATTIGDLYNLAVLAILVVTLLGLVYRFDERSNRHYRSIEVLTEFIRDIEDLVALSAAGARLLTEDDLTATRERYKGILAALPPSSDREYLRAKKSATGKREKARDAERIAGEAPARWDDMTSKSPIEPALGSQLAGIVLQQPWLGVLTVVRNVLGESAWVTGGFVREAAWDHVHGFVIPTAWSDVDIVYFDPDRKTEDDEHRLEAKLQIVSANVKWSVKNQARMHKVAGDAPYESLEAAVRRFPETATAIACRLGRDNRIKLLAPHGLRDLFDLKVRRTPGFDLDRFRRRVSQKRWKSIWTRLEIEQLRDELAKDDEPGR